MKYSFILLLIFGGYTCFGNDGVFYSRGNTLIPLNETTIQLKKEVLNLTLGQYVMQVDIYFEFFNPGEEKELLVGFVTPPADGVDIGEKEQAHPEIREFGVMVDNELLPYKITRLKKSGFKLAAKTADGDDFVYHFTVKFRKGITVIRHSYQYLGGHFSDGSGKYDYRLSTGATWANKAIEDFELNITMGQDVLFSVPASFNAEKAGWNVVGIGKINPADGNDNQTVFIRTGCLQFRQKHFVPATDLSINTFARYHEYLFWCAQGVKNDFEEISDFFDIDVARDRIPQFSNEQLRLFRNLHYARQGYDFKDTALKRSFSKYVWYIPDPNLKLEGFKEHYFNKEVQAVLDEEERKRKAKK